MKRCLQSVESHTTALRHVKAHTNMASSIGLKESILVISCLLLCCCSHRQTERGREVPMRYAWNISIEDYGAYRLVSMANPWQPQKQLHRYVLIAREDSARMAGRNLPEGTVIYTPLRRSVVFNTAHAQLACWLGAAAQIRGVADLKYMNVPEMKNGVATGRVVDCGNSMAPDVEAIVQLRADGVLLSPFENSGGYGRLEQIGVPIIECAEYMETSPLGRAEWMRFYGMLYGKEQEADSLFALVESEYQKLKSRSRPLSSRPSLLTEKLTGSTWYIPGGKSTVAQLIADAGATYAWSMDEHSGSLALSFETVVSKAADADVWLFNDIGDKATYERLASENQGYRLFKAYKQHRVWSVNSLKEPYFEEVSFRPDRLLRDYIIMLHPGLLQGSTRYYKELKD